MPWRRVICHGRTGLTRGYESFWGNIFGGGDFCVLRDWNTSGSVVFSDLWQKTLAWLLVLRLFQVVKQVYFGAV